MTPEETANQIMQETFPGLRIVREHFPVASLHAAALRRVFSPFIDGVMQLTELNTGVPIFARIGRYGFAGPPPLERVAHIGGNQGSPEGAVTAILKGTPAEYATTPGRPN